MTGSSGDEDRDHRKAVAGYITRMSFRCIPWEVSGCARRVNVDQRVGTAMLNDGIQYCN